MKKIIITLSVVFCLFFVAIAALVFFVNPNQFKPLLVQEVKKSTGLDLSINADINWTFFPSFGLELGEIELKNPDGFSRTNLAKVDNVSVNVGILPLLDHTLQIGEVNLDGADIQLEKLKSGQTNYEFSATQTEKKTQSQETVTSSSGEVSDKSTSTETISQSGVSQSRNAWNVEVAGIAINHAKFAMIDHVANSTTQINDLSLKITEFEFNKWTPFSFEVAGKIDQQQFNFAGSGEFNIDQQLKQYALQNMELNAAYNNADIDIEKATLSFASFALDQTSPLKLSVKMKGNGISGTVEGQSELLVNSALSDIKLSGLALTGDLAGDKLPMQKLKVNLNSNISLNTKTKKADITIPQLVVNDITLDGQLNALLSEIPKIRFDFHTNKLDVDSLLASMKTKQVSADDKKSTNVPASSSPSATKTTNSSAQHEPDLSALSMVDLAGSVRIDDLKANNVKITNWDSAIQVKNGKAILSKFTADLYDGTVSANATLNATAQLPTYNLDADIKSVQIQPLLVALADKDVLEGTGNITASINGKSLITDKLMKNLAGTLDIDFADGAVNGINIAQMIRVRYAQFKGETVADEESVKKTDFSSLTSTVDLKNGVASTSNLTMASPLLRVHGEGSANYIKQTTDFLVRTSVVKSLEGQGGKGIDELRDVTIPIKVTGAWDDLKYRLVFDDVLKQKAEKEIDRGLEKLDSKIKDEKTKEAINSLLKGLLK